jgi:TatD DNase family protein
MYYNIHTHRFIPQTEVFSIENKYQDFGDELAGRKVSMGMHPWYLDVKYPEEQFRDLRNNALKQDVLAIGECGLDKLTATPWELQCRAFQWQIDLAQEINKPVIIHCVKAFGEVLEQLKQISIPVIFHGINNKLTVVKPVIERGYYLSFGKALLSDRDYIVKTFQAVPLDRVFLETDDSDTDIREIYKSAAKIKNITEKEIVLQLEKNFLNVFHS